MDPDSSPSEPDLSAVGPLIDSDQDSLANLPVHAVTCGHLTVEGYSRAAVQSYWRIPELRIGFDLGGSPWGFMGIETYCVTHAHLDHMAALPSLVARRRMMKLTPPKIFLPAAIVDDVQRLLHAWQRLDRGRMVCDLVGVSPGDEFELSRELVLTCFPTRHTVPSVGFMVWDRRRKLKPEFQGLSGNEIRDLRQGGTEVTHEIRLPLVAYVGDSSCEGLDACPDIYRARILITEMTFFRPEHQKEKIRKFGHMHLDDVLDRASRFENELIVLAHLSTRTSYESAKRAVERRLPAALKSRVVLWPG